MKAINYLINVAIGAVILVTTLYFVISVCIAFFKLSEQLVDEGRMFFDLRTPTRSGLLAFQAVCVAIIALAFTLRRKLKRVGPTP